MTLRHLMAASATMLTFLASPAAAQQRAGTSGLRLPPPAPPSIGGFGHGFGGGFPVFVVEREVPVVVRVETPAPAPPPSAKADGPPPRSGEERKPYVVGASYASLPGSCMKLIEEGVSFYYCSGDWYRQEGKSYRAVARRL